MMPKFKFFWLISGFRQDVDEICALLGCYAAYSSKKGKVHPCTGTEALYRPYGP